MKPKILTFLCSLVVLSSLIAQAQVSKRTRALLTVQCQATWSTCDKYNLVRYRFNNGELISKDTFLTTEVEKLGFGLGDHRIYRNRFVITDRGDVIDIENKKILYQGDGDLVAVEGDQVIHKVKVFDKVRRDFRARYFVYDLKLNRHGRLRLPSKWALPGTLSPDQTKSAAGENGKLWLYTMNGKRKFLGSGFEASGDISESIISYPTPALWLDNHRILTQRGNGKIVVVRLDGAVADVVDIPVKRDGVSRPDFDLNDEGKPVYSCSDGLFIIDVKNRTYVRSNWVELAHQFDHDTENNPAYGHIFRYQGTEIGRFWSGTSSTTDGYLAVEYGDVGSNLGYPKGIKVWSRYGGKWTTIDIGWLSTIIDWVDE